MLKVQSLTNEMYSWNDVIRDPIFAHTFMLHLHNMQKPINDIRKPQMKTNIFITFNICKHIRYKKASND